MIRSRLGSIKQENARLKIRLVTVVWGNEYVNSMIQISWRGLLAPSNLPALSRHFDISYALYIRSSEAAIATNSAQYSLLSQFVRIELNKFGGENSKDRYEQHWDFWKEAIEAARCDGAIVLLAIPDLLFFDGVLERWGELIQSGKRAIFSIGTWVCEETFLPEFLTRFPMASDDYVALKRNEGINLIHRHMHPVIAASFRQSGRSLYHFDRMTEAVPGMGFISRSFSSQPLLFDPSYFKLDRNRAPVNRLSDVVMDDISNFSTGAMLHVAEFYHGQSPFGEDRIAGLVNWAPPNVGLSHAFESRFNYAYPNSAGMAVDEAWDLASKKLDATRSDLLTVHSASMIWNHARNTGHTRVCDALTLAIWHHKIQSAISVTNAFTVFLPEDGAFSGENGKLFTSALESPNPASLMKIILGHVVSERLYLRLGDYFTFDSMSGDTKGDKLVAKVKNLVGKQMYIFRPKTNDCSNTTKVSVQQIRLGFGAIYSINFIIF